MENTALNDTTTKDQDWKQKKGYVPLIVLTAVLLGLAFCAGQSRGTSLAVGSSAGANLNLQWPPVDMEPPKPFCVLIKDKADCLNATDDDGTQCYWTQRFGINHCLKKTEKHSFRGGAASA